MEVLRTKPRPWTEEEDAILRERYQGSDYSIQHIMQALPGRTYHGVRGRARRLGFYKHRKIRTWTDDEVEKLHDLVEKHGVKGAARLLGHTCAAVRTILSTRKVRYGRDGWYTATEAAAIIGIGRKRLARYVHDGVLKGASLHDSGHPALRIEDKHLRDFIIRYRYDLTGRNVDVPALIDIVLQGKIPVELEY